MHCGGRCENDLTASRPVANSERRCRGGCRRTAGAEGPLLPVWLVAGGQHVPPLLAARLCQTCRAVTAVGREAVPQGGWWPGLTKGPCLPLRRLRSRPGRLPKG